jgi:hypothetical protein
LRITNFEGRSVDLHIRSPADYAPIQSYMTTVGEPAQKVHLLRCCAVYFVDDLSSGSSTHPRAQTPGASVTPLLAPLFLTLQHPLASEEARNAPQPARIPIRSPSGTSFRTAPDSSKQQ